MNCSEASELDSADIADTASLACERVPSKHIFSKEGYKLLHTKEINSNRRGKP